MTNWWLFCPLVISRRRRRPGDGRYCNAPVCPSVRLSVRPSVTFNFRTVTQKCIAVFSRNFAGTCTKSWGVLYSYREPKVLGNYLRAPRQYIRPQSPQNAVFIPILPWFMYIMVKQSQNITKFIR